MKRTLLLFTLLLLLISSIFFILVHSAEAGTIKVIKRVAGWSGAGNPPLPLPSTFRLFVQGNVISINGVPPNLDGSFQGNSRGTMITLSPGPYSITEGSSPHFTTHLSDVCNGNISEGMTSTVTCIVTNALNAAKFGLDINVINDNGGNKQPSDFTFKFLDDTQLIDGTLHGTFPGGRLAFMVVPPAESFNSTISLINGPANYKLRDFICDIPGASTEGYLTLIASLRANNSNTCTLTLDDVPIPGTLTVIKHVINDNGGSKKASDFGVTVVSKPSSLIVVPPRHFTGLESPGEKVQLLEGRYNVSEDPLPGYSSSFSPECSGRILSGQNKTCTIVNNDIAPKLIVIKHVINDAGGMKTAQDFTIHVIGNASSPSQFFGSESGTLVTLNNGSYSADEDNVRFYTKFRSPSCFGIINIGENKTCTITNDDQVLPLPGILTIKKIVQNNDGGVKGPSDFTVHVSAPSSGAIPSTFQGSAAGTSVSVIPGPYNVREDPVAEYSSSLSGDCSGFIASRQNKTCTITNDDKEAILLVKKHVVNNEDGDASASEFSIQIKPVSPEPLSHTIKGSEQGVKILVAAGFIYNVREVGDDGDRQVFIRTHPYDVSYSTDCTNVFVKNGEVKTCTVTNNDVVE